LVVELNGFHLAPILVFGWVGEVNQVIPQKGIYPPDLNALARPKWGNMVERESLIITAPSQKTKILSSPDKAKLSLLSPVSSSLPLVRISISCVATSAGRRPRSRRGGGYCTRARRRRWQQLHAGKVVGYAAWAMNMNEIEVGPAV
jgi:hypothetical protein